MVEGTEWVQVEDTYSGGAKVNEWNNNLKTEVREDENSRVVVTCDENNHNNYGSNHNDAGCNHGDAGCNHGDAGCNHGDKTPVEHKSEVEVNAENAEHETKEAIPSLPGKNYN